MIDKEHGLNTFKVAENRERYDIVEIYDSYTRRFTYDRTSLEELLDILYERRNYYVTMCKEIDTKYMHDRANIYDCLVDELETYLSMTKVFDERSDVSIYDNCDIRLLNEYYRFSRNCTIIERHALFQILKDRTDTKYRHEFLYEVYRMLYNNFDTNKIVDNA